MRCLGTPLLIASLCACGPDEGLEQGEAEEAVTGGCTYPAEADRARLERTWSDLEAAYRITPEGLAQGFGDAMESDLLAGKTRALYDAQLLTANLLMHAEYVRDLEQLAGLARVYVRAFSPNILLAHTQGLFYYATPAGAAGPVRESVWTFPRPIRMWTGPPAAGFSVGQETILDSAQFLYAVSRLVRIAAEVPSRLADPRDQVHRDALVAFAQTVTRVVVLDHYERWIKGLATTSAPFPGSFQVRGWGCNDGTFNHRQRLGHLLNRRFGTTALPRPSASPAAYCNVLTDLDLWIITGVLEILRANQASPTLVPLTAAQRAAFTSYATLGVRLVKARLVANTISTATGPVQGMILDPTGFNGHPDWKYAGYVSTSAACSNCQSVGQCTCSQFPGWVDADHREAADAPRPATGLGWDISHARRLISVFDSFRRHRRQTPGYVVTDAEVASLARQFRHRVWNQNAQAPKFSNFYSGANGWYRVNYSSRPAFGIPPHSFSSIAPLAGYGMWAELASGIKPPLDLVFDRQAAATSSVTLQTTIARNKMVIQGLPAKMVYRGIPAQACPR